MLHFRKIWNNITGDKNRLYLESEFIAIPPCHILTKFSSKWTQKHQLILPCYISSTPGSPSTSPDALYKSAPRLHEPKKLLRSASWRAPKKEATMKSREKPQTFAIPPAQTSYETEFPRLSILNSAMPHDTSVKVPDVRGSNGDQPMRNSLGVWDQESKAPSESSAAKDETIPLKTDASAEVHDKIGENVEKDLIGGQLWDIINRFGPKESTPDSSVVLH